MVAAKFRPAILSRLLVVIAALVALYFGYWFVRLAFAPVPVPPSAPRRSSIRFNPNLDVSKHELFIRLRPLGPLEVQPGQRGRVNPFISVPSVSTSTVVTTTAVSVTATSLER